MNPGLGIAKVVVKAILFTLLFTLFGCTPAVEQHAGEEGREPPPEEMQYDRLSLPATFVGSIPCEDCERVDIVLNLRPDQIYQLRKTNIASRERVQKVESQMRNWRFSRDGRMIILGKQKGMLKTYVVTDDNTLVFLESEGERGTEPIRYNLTRSPGYDPFGDSVKIRGMFSASEGGAVIQECSSGKVFRVARSGEYEQAVKEYLRLPHNPGEPLLLSFSGKLEGTGQVGDLGEMITIDEYNQLYLNRNCLGESVNASLTGTVWTLETIGGRQTTSFKYREPPYLIMSRDDSVEGFGGCNEIKGNFLVRGDVLLFERTIQTRMACLNGNELESLFFEVLDEAEFFSIEADKLTIMDQDGDVMATFTGG